MSVLVIQIPSRARLGAHGQEPASAIQSDGLDFAFSPEGITAESHGRAQLPLLPRADTVIAVLADADVGWHQVTLPRAPSSRMREALGGLLEDQLLDDDNITHYALAPKAGPGLPTWVAVVNKPWLQDALAQLDAAGIYVDAVVPASAPSETARGHFYEGTPDDAGETPAMLCHCDDQGVTLLSLSGSLAKTLAPRLLSGTAHWTATPGVAALAEHWLGSSVTVMGEADRLLLAARSAWNLRQFDLAPRNRGTRALRAATHQFFRPPWRPVRLGLIALVLVQLVGLNAWAWRQKAAIADKQAAKEAVLRGAYPQVRVVLDASAQMQRETDALRSQAGQTGDQDLEALLSAAASAWPEGQAPTATVRFELGKLSLGSTGWSDAQMSAFKEQLRASGWAAEAADGRVTLSRMSEKKNP